MKHSTLITKTLIAGLFTLSMASQVTAAESTQVRFEVGSPALGGTREGIQQSYTRTEAEDDQAVGGLDAATYRAIFEAGSPALGGTREGMHRKRVEVESHQVAAQQVNQSEYASLEVSSTRQGTRG